MRPWYRIVSYRIEKKTLISYRYRIESKKSLSLFIGYELVMKIISGINISLGASLVTELDDPGEKDFMFLECQL